MNQKYAVKPASLLVRFTKHDQRYKKCAIFLRRKQLDPLRWTIPNPVILQKTQVEIIFTNVCKISPKEPEISNSRVYLDSSLHSNSWNRPNRKHAFFTNQRGIQKNYWHEEIAPSNCDKTFSISSYSRCNPADCQSSQFNSEENISYFTH